MNDSNPYRPPSNYESPGDADAELFITSWTTLALVFASTILGWIWVGVIGSVLVDGLHVRNCVGAGVLAVISTVTAVALQTVSYTHLTLPTICSV